MLLELRDGTWNVDDSVCGAAMRVLGNMSRDSPFGRCSASPSQLQRLADHRETTAPVPVKGDGICIFDDLDIWARVL